MNSSNQLIQRLERKGWTLKRAIEEPEEKIPVPSPPFPPGRMYHFVDNREIALIVARGNEVIASIPGHEAWQVLESETPELLAERLKDKGGATAVMKYAPSAGNQGYILPTADLSHAWNVQVAVTSRGVYTVHADKRGGVVVLLGSRLLGEYKNADEMADSDDYIPFVVVEAAALIEVENEEG